MQRLIIFPGTVVSAPTIVKVDPIDLTKLNVSWTVPTGALAKEVSLIKVSMHVVF